MRREPFLKCNVSKVIAFNKTRLFTDSGNESFAEVMVKFCVTLVFVEPASITNTTCYPLTFRNTVFHLVYLYVSNRE